jgi:3-dehydro-L-gulonate 2-dehydrogenase
MRISYEDMIKEFTRILMNKGFDEERALASAKIFADTSLDGVYSHGYIRFPRVIEYIDKGYIKVDAVATKVDGMGALERWDGNQGMGNLNAQLCMDRAIELAKSHGIGLVALGNTNHWMRGGTYGWQAASEGCIGICWTNTSPNMPAWGGIDKKIGNNPFVLSIPRSNGNHVVVDLAMAQYSYGKLETTRLESEQLPYPGGFDKEGNLTNDPSAIEETGRVLPIGYWKGSGMSIALDLIANVLAMGNTVTQVGKNETEYGLTQVMIAIDPSFVNHDKNGIEELINLVLEDVKSSVPAKEGGKVYYPGESTINRRKDNLANGIPVNEDIWNSICNM